MQSVHFSNLSTSGMIMPAGMEHLTVEQQQVMMQQNWQQWQSYYQQYAQWQAQYGQQVREMRGTLLAVGYN